MKLTIQSEFKSSTQPSLVIIPFVEDHIEKTKDVLADYHIHTFEKLKQDLSHKKITSHGCYTSLENISKVYLIKVKPDHGPAGWKTQFSELSGLNKAYSDHRLVLDLRAVYASFDPARLNSFISASAIGLTVGYYNIDLYKAERDPFVTISELLIISKEIDQSDSSAAEAKVNAVSQAILSVLDLVNAPSNHKTSTELAEWAQKSAKAFNYKVDIFNKGDLEREGMHALLAVNRGSATPPKCIITSYIGESESPMPTVALVGKGVTFDTGGLSIKGAQNMHYMKSDMGGAAAVLGAVQAAAALRLPIKLHGIIPVTENSVDGESIKPGDVISSFKGSTIEVINTDAEGRLILADGLAYAVKRFSPDYMIDLATLTGSVVRALGYHAAGMMTNNESLAGALYDAGQRSGERVWRLPLWKDYGEYMESEIADIKNLSDKPLAGSITAGKFLEHFTDNHSAWAHIDIAGTAFGPNSLSVGYSATAFGVHLLVEWMETLKNGNSTI